MLFVGILLKLVPVRVTSVPIDPTVGLNETMLGGSGAACDKDFIKRTKTRINGVIVL
jgi:hypothetical protein